MTTQHALWHDTPEDALRSAVDGLGGFKKVGSELWPAMPVSDAGKKLANCLDADRPDKLSLAELSMVLRLARGAGIHTGLAFFAKDAGYADPVPVDPETEKEKLMREFIKASQTMAAMSVRIQTLQSRA